MSETPAEGGAVPGPGREQPAHPAAEPPPGGPEGAASAARPPDASPLDGYDFGEVEPASVLRLDLLLGDGAPGAR